MTTQEKNKLKNQAEEFMKKLESVDEKDKDIILASLRGMLLVADVNKKKEKVS